MRAIPGLVVEVGVREGTRRDRGAGGFGVKIGKVRVSRRSEGLEGSKFGWAVGLGLTSESKR